MKILRREEVLESEWKWDLDIKLLAIIVSIMRHCLATGRHIRQGTHAQNFKYLAAQSWHIHEQKCTFMCKPKCHLLARLLFSLF